MSFPNLSLWAVQHRALVGFLMLACGLAGVDAYNKLGRAEDPSFTIKTGLVSGQWPGATTEQVQHLFSDKVEEKLQELPFLDFLRTYTSNDSFVTIVQFKDSSPRANMDQLWYQLRKKLDDLHPALPDGTLGPFVDDEFGDVYSALYAISGADFKPNELKHIAEKAREKILKIKDVGKVKLFGVQAERVFVEISHLRLAKLGILPQQIIDTLQRQNAMVSAGSIDTRADRISMRVSGAFDALTDIEQLPLDVAGKSLRLVDVADIRRGSIDPPTYVAKHNGQPCVVLGVVMRKGGNIVELGRELVQCHDNLISDVPAGANLETLSFQPRVVEESVGEFLRSFIEALIIVLFVSFLSLGVRTGIIVALSIPLVLAMSLVTMNFIGLTLDRITLGALILSLGLLVDDAIIAVEMMAVKLEEGFDKVRAATFAWQSTAFPMLSGTMITVAGFLPVGFNNSAAGEYAGGIFWVLAISLSFSWLVAVTFTPLLGVLILKVHDTTVVEHVQAYNSWFYRILRFAISRCVANPILVVTTTVAMFAIALFGFTTIPQQFFPQSPRPELIISVRLPEGASFDATAMVVERIEAVLQSDVEVEQFTSYIGGGTIRFFLALEPDIPATNVAKIVLGTRSTEHRERVRKRLLACFQDDPQFADARIRLLKLDFGPPVGFPVQFRVIGPSTSEVRRIARQVLEIMRNEPTVVEPNLEWNERSKAIRFELDLDRARLLGLSRYEISNVLRTLVSGLAVSQFREGRESMDVVVRAIESERVNLDKLPDFSLYARKGTAIPLSQVATLKCIQEEPALWRRNREMMLTVRSDIVDGWQAPDVSKLVEKGLTQLKGQLPPGYRIETGGAIEESNKANAALFDVFPAMILVMLTLLMAQTQSFRKSFLVFVISPLGLIGAITFLHLLQAPFGFTALLGVIALAGMDMRNSVILIDQIEQDIANGLAPYDAVIESAVRRARPVILTAATAILAMIPLTRSVFWGPMAIAIMGGLSVATFLTLINLPAIYVLLFRVRRAAN